MDQVQITTSFHDTVVDTVEQEQEDIEANVAVEKRYEPLYLKEEALAPSPLTAIQMAERELAQEGDKHREQASSESSSKITFIIYYLLL